MILDWSEQNLSLKPSVFAIKYRDFRARFPAERSTFQDQGDPNGGELRAIADVEQGADFGFLYEGYSKAKGMHSRLRWSYPEMTNAGLMVITGGWILIYGDIPSGKRLQFTMEHHHDKYWINQV